MNMASSLSSTMSRDIVEQGTISIGQLDSLSLYFGSLFFILLQKNPVLNKNEYGDVPQSNYVTWYSWTRDDFHRSKSLVLKYNKTCDLKLVVFYSWSQRPSWGQAGSSTWCSITSWCIRHQEPKGAADLQRSKICWYKGRLQIRREDASGGLWSRYVQPWRPWVCFQPPEGWRNC